MQTENDLVCKMLKGTVSRKNKTFHTKSVALDMMGRARLISKNIIDAVVDGGDPLARGSRDLIPIPPPFRTPPSPRSSDASMSDSDEDEDGSD